MFDEVIDLANARQRRTLQSHYERKYNALTTRKINGEDGVILQPWKNRLEEKIPLNSLIEARFILTPGRAAYYVRHIPEPANDPRRLMQIRDSRFNISNLSLLARRLPYAEKQGLLVTDEDLPQELNWVRLLAAFTLAQAMTAYTYIFNRGGRTMPRFHIQMFKGQPPLFEALHKSSREKIFTETFQSGPVLRHQLDMSFWPVQTTVFRSTEPETLAKEVCLYLQTEAAHNWTYDMIWQCRNGTLWVLVFRRGYAEDERFESRSSGCPYSPERKELGHWGALELAANVVAIQDADTFHRLIEDKQSLAERYTQALQAYNALIPCR